MIASVIMLFFALGDSHAATSSPAALSTVAVDDGSVGSCRNNSGYFDLRKVLLLKNSTIDIKDSNDPVRITIEQQKLRIQRFNDADQSTYIVNVGNIISGEPDIVLTLGLLDNDPVLYWKETFIHRSYRQGLFRISGHSLVPLCQGIGGGALID